MNFSIAISRKIALAYSAVCKPLCRQLELPQTAFDILMFLGNNPDYKTASEIVEIRHIKANLVSVNVDRLVREGYLTRRGAEWRATAGRQSFSAPRRRSPSSPGDGSCKMPFPKGCLPVWTRKRAALFRRRCTSSSII